MRREPAAAGTTAPEALTSLPEGPAGGEPTPAAGPGGAYVQALRGRPEQPDEPLLDDPDAALGTAGSPDPRHVASTAPDLPPPVDAAPTYSLTSALRPLGHGSGSAPRVRVAWADDDLPADWSYLHQVVRPRDLPVPRPDATDPPPAPGEHMPSRTSTSASTRGVPDQPRKGGSPAAETPGEPWTAEELAEVRGELQAQAVQLRAEIDDAESTSAAAQRDASGEGSGDEADAGTKTFEREHEMSLANNSRDLLQQVERALARIDDGTYGRCERCGGGIPKPRLQAFPRATLCVGCKQREERR